jgi:heme A synthase
MEDFHRYLGEGLFIVYLVALIAAFLAIQVAVGLILLLSGGLRGVHWLHPVVGLLAIASLGLAPVFKGKLRPGMDKAALFGVVAALALFAQVIAQMSR